MERQLRLKPVLKISTSYDFLMAGSSFLVIHVKLKSLKCVTCFSLVLLVTYFSHSRPRRGKSFCRGTRQPITVLFVLAHARVPALFPCKVSQLRTYSLTCSSAAARPTDSPRHVGLVSSEAATRSPWERKTTTTTTMRPARSYLERRRRRNVGQSVGTISWHLGRKAGARRV